MYAHETKPIWSVIARRASCYRAHDVRRQIFESHLINIETIAQENQRWFNGRTASVTAGTEKKTKITKDSIRGLLSAYALNAEKIEYRELALATARMM